MTSDEEDLLEQILTAVASDDYARLTDWERGFMQDQQKRYEEYGADTRLSPKQWTFIKRSGAKYGVPGCEG